MRTRQVRWFEGMLVLPHHFQAAEDNLRDWLATSVEWVKAYSYGIRLLDVNQPALANYEIRIPHVQARMKDGTMISVPENGQLPVLDVRSKFERDSELFILLLLPHIVPGRPNSSHGRADNNQEHRFLIATERHEELNSGDNNREIDTHYLNVQLKAQSSLETPAGYESLPLMKLRRSGQPGAVPEIDPSYIPPLLTCEYCAPLQQNILLAICSQLGSYVKTTAESLNTLGGWAESNSPQVHRAILQLSAANSSYPFLLQLFQTKGLHPHQAYCELCRLVGQLSIVRSDWQPPKLPIYDHDDLGGIFVTIQKEIEAIFQADASTTQVLRFPFVGIEMWSEVNLERDWLVEGTEFYIGIQSEVPAEALERLFAKSHLDWKLGSSGKISQIYTNAESGLRVQRFVEQSATLPMLKNMTYFRIETTGPYWQQLLESPTLALKVNDRFLDGDFAGTNRMTVLDEQGGSIKLVLDLFVVKNG